MDWINYHHLYYFWLTAKCGSMAQAAKELRLARPTVSAQIGQLQERMGQNLFRKEGRGLVLTNFGQGVFSYADEIFAAGQKLKNYVAQKPEERTEEFVIGVSDVLPKVITYSLLEPLMAEFKNIKLICVEGATDHLVGQLGVHNVDVVISDAPVGQNVDVRIFHHKLGDCGLSFFCAESLWQTQKKPFPECLGYLPILLPSKRTSIRRAINHWMESLDIMPKVAAEFDDSALMKVFGQNGSGIYVAPSIMTELVEKQFESVCIGSVESIRDTFYLVSTRKRLENPFVKKLVAMARESLFGSALREY